LKDKYIIKNIKRLIGFKYSDQHIQDNLAFYPSIRELNNEIIIMMRGVTYTVKELITIFFIKLKEIIFENIKKVVTDIVLTVPAYFNEYQRSICKDAIELAELNVMKIINEPTAAAITTKTSNTCLIYDLGGGTLDVTILKQENQIYNVIETTGYSHLGGEDFNNKLVLHVAKEFCNKMKIEISTLMNNIKSVNKLKKACKIGRECLSTQISCDIFIDSLYLGNDFFIKINRSTFENICFYEFSKCATILNKLENKNLVEEIVLVGGATRMAKIKTILSSIFPGILINDKANPDLVVSLGAGIVANKLFEDDPVLLLDVIALPYGIELSGGLFGIVVDKNLHLPIKKVKVFATEYDNQPSFTLNIYEGDNQYAKQNQIIGTIYVNDLPLMKKGDLKIFIKFKVDYNGILTLTVKYNKVKIVNAFNSNRGENIVFKESELFIAKSVELLKFKECLINYKYYLEGKKLPTVDNLLLDVPIINDGMLNKVSKLLDWVIKVNDKQYLEGEFITVESIKKMKEYILSEMIL
jgi:molecular chaperone DnaK (HSP70)